MKKLILLFTILFAGLFTASAKSTIKTDTITVGGNCGQCKERIEEAAYTVSGLKSANWNKKTHQLIVVYTAPKATISKITNAILNSGHDANGVKASDEMYKTLPACCAYREGKCAHEKE
jgi:periplasmic mercuric ion binding protein